jgi:methionyl-tRNA formyltransferase
VRVIFFGTPEFAVPTLRAVIAGPHALVGVVSQPDRPRGRGRSVHPSPVSAVALEQELPLLRPERVGEPEIADALRALAPDLGVVVAFGQFLPKRIRELPTRGYLINAHASLLPDYRGAAPIARALLDGRTETGISVMRVEKEMDAGAVARVHRLAIEPDEDCGSLTARLAQVAAEAIAEALDDIAADRVHWTEQDHERASFAPKIESADARLDWTRPARELAHQVRAMAPSPGARSPWDGEPLRILAAEAAAGRVDDSPGTVRHRDGGLAIATGEGWLLPRTLQRAGGKALAVADFLRGRPIPDGTRLGD